MIDMKNKQKEFASIQEEAKDLLSRIKNEGIDISKTLGEEGLNTIKKSRS